MLLQERVPAGALIVGIIEFLTSLMLQTIVSRLAAILYVIADLNADYIDSICKRGNGVLHILNIAQCQRKPRLLATGRDRAENRLEDALASRCH